MPAAPAVVAEEVDEVGYDLDHAFHASGANDVLNQAFDASNSMLPHDLETLSASALVGTYFDGR
ncbi:hypothetical protein D3C87_2081870 [compost metagenome]